MSESEWHRIWVLVLVEGGIALRDAHHAFFVCYGNQLIDLNKDPIFDALTLVPREHTRLLKQA
jgi:hypothetical protein